MPFFGRNARVVKLYRVSFKDHLYLPLVQKQSKVVQMAKAEASMPIKYAILKYWNYFKLNASWNSVYRRIFGFNRWESLRAFITGYRQVRPAPHLHAKTSEFLLPSEIYRSQIAIFFLIFYGLVSVWTVLTEFYCPLALDRIGLQLSVAYMETVRLLNWSSFYF